MQNQNITQEMEAQSISHSGTRKCNWKSAETRESQTLKEKKQERTIQNRKLYLATPEQAWRATAPTQSRPQNWPNEKMLNIMIEYKDKYIYT